MSPKHERAPRKSPRLEEIASPKATAPIPLPVPLPTPQVTAKVAPKREHMPDTRIGNTRVFRLHYQHKDGQMDVMQVYITINTYPDGRLGEVLVKADKSGEMARGLLETIGILISVGIQYGIPVQVFIDKLRHSRFGPCGFTGDPDIKSCSSPTDLLAQLLQLRLGSKDPG